MRSRSTSSTPASRSKTPTARASMAACATNASTNTGSSASAMPAGSWRPGGRITIGTARTARSAIRARPSSSSRQARQRQRRRSTTDSHNSWTKLRGQVTIYTASRGSIESTFALEFLTMLGIDWLLSPYDKNVFFEEIWQKRPEVLATGRAGYFEGVFSKEEVERIIEFAQPRPPLIKLSSASSDDWAEVPFSPNGRIDIDRLRKLYLQGETVILNKVEDFSPAVARLARAIETEMGARVQVNSYLTPPSAQAFPPHYDTHDV